MVLAFGDALDAGPGSPGRATLFTGARGVGKTVMLNEAERQARERGWVVISETATPGLCTRLTTEGLPLIADQLELESDRRRLTGLALPLGLGGADFDIERQPSPEPGLRTQLATITDYLDEHDTGLLITVDEIHRGARVDLELLGTVVQHCFREERPVALAAAGLPSAVQDLLTDHVLTFLRRAERHTLGPVDDADVVDALDVPVRASGRDLTDEALVEASRGTGGYPFLIQLIGYWTWNDEPAADTITVTQARNGIQAARRRMGSLIHEPALFDLSAVDRTFLAAMALDDRPSRMKDIAERLHATTNYASQYRLRLIASGMIRPTGHGTVDFNLPYLRDYLREHAAHLGIDQPTTSGEPA